MKLACRLMVAFSLVATGQATDTQVYNDESTDKCQFAGNIMYGEEVTCKDAPVDQVMMYRLMRDGPTLTKDKALNITCMLQYIIATKATLVDEVNSLVEIQNPGIRKWQSDPRVSKTQFVSGLLVHLSQIELGAEILHTFAKLQPLVVRVKTNLQELLDELESLESQRLHDCYEKLVGPGEAAEALYDAPDIKEAVQDVAGLYDEIVEAGVFPFDTESDVAIFNEDASLFKKVAHKRWLRDFAHAASLGGYLNDVWPQVPKK